MSGSVDGGLHRGADQWVIVEFGGTGGVFDTACSMAQVLAQSSAVTLAVPAPRLAWKVLPRIELHSSGFYAVYSREWRWPASRIALLRRSSAGLRALFVLVMLCHTLGKFSHTVRVMVQGQGLHPVLALFLVMRSRIGGHYTVLAPHNVFVRRLNIAGTLALKAAIRLADRIIWHETPVPAAVGQYVPLLVPAQVFSQSNPEILTGNGTRPLRNRDCVRIVGYLRPDKGVLSFAEEVVKQKPPWFLELVGQATSDELRSALARLERTGRIALKEGYLPPAGFIDSIRGADCLVLPYYRTSGSAVLMNALVLGVPVVTVSMPMALEAAAAGAAVWISSTGNVEDLFHLVDTIMRRRHADLTYRIACGTRYASDKREQVEKILRKLSAT